MTFAPTSHNFMPTYCGVNVCLVLCESTNRRFQTGEGPSRGLLHDCEIFTNLREPSFEALLHSGHSGASVRCRDYVTSAQLSTALVSASQHKQTRPQTSDQPCIWQTIIKIILMTILCLNFPLVV